MINPRASQLSVIVTNTCENNLVGRNGSFWLSVLGISVHDQLAPFLWSGAKQHIRHIPSWQGIIKEAWGEHTVSFGATHPRPEDSLEAPPLKVP